MGNYFSDLGPDFKKRTIKLQSIPAYQYDASPKEELAAKKIS